MTKLTDYQLEALNYDRHISLTANAGSGKTFVLSKRFVKIAVNEKLDLDKIIAITFTDKAASELYKKISDEIIDQIESETDRKKRVELERIRRQLVSANISTIHSFCTNILKEFPLEANLDANFTPIDAEKSNELVNECFDKIVKKSLFGEDSKLTENFKYLVRIFGAIQLLQKEMTKLIDKRNQIKYLSTELYSKIEETIALKFTELSNFYLEKILDFDEIINAIKIVNQEVLSAGKNNEFAEETEIKISRILSTDKPIEKLKKTKEIAEIICTQKMQLKSRGYLSKKLQENVKDEVEFLNEIFSQIKSIKTDSFDDEKNIQLAEFGKKFLDVFHHFEYQYSATKQMHGYIDFQDILLKVENLLENWNVVEKLSERFKYIMIDEYQDTNELQYKIFMPILNQLKKGNLFVVGDEKQSIYRFRNAELAVFEQTKNEIKQEDGKAIELPHSFRMLPNLALFVNKLFENLFVEPQLLFNEVKSKELIATIDGEKRGSVEILLTDAEEGETEAEKAAKRILELKKTGKLDFDDITVLSRKRNSFNDLEKTFDEYKIPYTVVGGRGFYNQQVIYDIQNYLSFLLDENNDKALLAILRSPFFTISDTKLYKISLQKGKSFFKKMKNYIKEDSSVLEIINILEDDLKNSSILDIPALIRSILERGYLAVVSAKGNSDQHIVNVKKLLTIASKYSDRGLTNLYDFVEYLKTAIENEHDESQAKIVEEGNLVKIMTIHQSKGLEFNCVILFGCNDRPNFSDIKAKSVQVDKEFGILTALPDPTNYFEKSSGTVIQFIYNLINRKKETAERKRLLYVALTRAKEKLIISSDFKNDYKFQKDSFSDYIFTGLNIDPSTESVKVKSQLKFLVNEAGKLLDKPRIVEFEIPIFKNIDDMEILDGTGEKESLIEVEFLIEKIDEKEKSEFISATKISIFSQCQVKYMLNYEYGYSRMHKMFFDESSSFQFNLNENEHYSAINSIADIKGTIIHSFLEKGMDKESIEANVQLLVNENLDLLDHKKVNQETFMNEIAGDLKNYLDSDFYNELSRNKNCYNEFEVYAKEKEFYLYGIIDKLIIRDNKCIILDYKTDDISKDDIKKRFEKYINQLKFYGYIVNKLYPEYAGIELMLSFIKYPDQPVKYLMNKKDFENTKILLESYITSVQNKEFVKNLSHCRECNYFTNNKCIFSD